MEKLIEMVKNLKKGGVERAVDARIRGFRDMGDGPGSEIFKELCFCILTANFTAAGGMRIQEDIGDGLLTMKEAALARRLKELGHRFPNTRARYIAEARKHKDSLKGLAVPPGNGDEIREWLAKNIKGIAYKEASHFLRNIGFGEGLAILDRHILKNLRALKIIKTIPKTITRKEYLNIEEKMKVFAKSIKIPLSHMDLLFWSNETGEIFK